MIEMSPHVRLAVATIDAYVRHGEIIDIPEYVSRDMLETSAGAFVCLKMDGQLRGCIGTIEPAMDNLALEIRENAISAAMRDPRFMPVEVRELEHIICQVDVLCPPEPVYDIKDLDAKRYGVIVESGLRRGLLLPDLDGVDSPEQQIDIARRKAFIKQDDMIKLYRFEIARFD
ncbi:MAG: AmmeMemoRadiSam system protein A [Armatimonadota bacterium]|nr:AmmeMemoRadiSam system protein A [bacterium]